MGRGGRSLAGRHGDRARPGGHRLRRPQRCPAPSGAGRGHPRFHARRPAQEADHGRPARPDARGRRQGHGLLRHARPARPQRSRTGGTGPLADRYRRGASGRRQARRRDGGVPRGACAQHRAVPARAGQRPAPVRPGPGRVLDRVCRAGAGALRRIGRLVPQVSRQRDPAGGDGSQQLRLATRSRLRPPNPGGARRAGAGAMRKPSAPSAKSWRCTRPGLAERPHDLETAIRGANTASWLGSLSADKAGWRTRKPSSSSRPTPCVAVVADEHKTPNGRKY